MVWRERIGGKYMASPIYANGRVYFSNHSGKTTVIKPGRKFENVAVNHLDDGLMASPVVVENSLIMRTKTHLYRIDKSEK
jgi:outer membrane protein assembly factor BamB